MLARALFRVPVRDASCTATDRRSAATDPRTKLISLVSKWCSLTNPTTTITAIAAKTIVWHLAVLLTSVMLLFTPDSDGLLDTDTSYFLLALDVLDDDIFEEDRFEE
jgi:hypothetical protein